MRSTHSILVPTDFSDNAANAFRYALELAGVLPGKVKVVHIVYPDYDMGMDFPVVAAQVTEEKVQVAREVMATFVREGMQAVFSDPEQAPDMETEVITGMPVEAIVRTCEAENHHLVVMGTRGDHSRWEQWVGTVAAGVVQQAPAHVLVVPEGAPYRSLERVACATDLQKADLFQVWKVAQLLREYSPSLYCVHVRTDSNGTAQLPPEELESFFTANMPSIDIRFFEIEGYSAGQSLIDFTRDQEVDLLVLFKPHRSPLERILRRSVTREMAIRSALPLLILKENGRTPM